MDTDATETEADEEKGSEDVAAASKAMLGADGAGVWVPGFYIAQLLGRELSNYDMRQSSDGILHGFF